MLKRTDSGTTYHNQGAITPRSSVCRSRELISRASCIGKNSRNNTIYKKQVTSIIENCKRKSNYAKGKFKTFRTRCLLNYRYSVDLPFRLELYQKSYICLKHRVTLRIYFFNWWLWIKVVPPIWPARLHMPNTFDRGVGSNRPYSRWPPCWICCYQAN